MKTEIDEMRESVHINRKLCSDYPGLFMICPRCDGSKLIIAPDFVRFHRQCDYCDGHGVICWIDGIIKNKKNPFLEGVK